MSANNSTMGKSNKFDYSKRGSSAAKLGQIISRDLKKEAERASKDAEKAAEKARKRSTGSCSGGSALGSGDRDGVSIDLQIPSKELGDEGACAMAEGLEIALCQGHVLLEDINLSNNGITTVSLARLAPIIRLARHDLKTLNLAGNNIRVETVEEAVQWEMFLTSFKDCYKLRRLDLSENVDLGAKAFEILAKVHLSEPLIDPLANRGAASVISLSSEEQLAEQTDACFFSDQMSRGGIIKRRTGLRSIPYITLSNTCLDDRSALWLSFILEDHHYPNQLIDGLNASSATSTIATYQQDTRSRGVDWNMKNPSQNRDGHFLLQKAENFREQVMLVEDQIFDGSEYAFELEDAEDQQSAMQTSHRRISRALPGDRRASIRSVRSIRTADGGEHELTELEGARRRLQRSLMTRYGVSRVELWSGALRLVISSRILVGIGPKMRNTIPFYAGPPKFDFTAFSPAVNLEGSTATSRPITPTLSFTQATSTPMTPTRQSTYAATLTGKSGNALSERDMNLSDITNTPRTSKRLFKAQRKGVPTDGSEIVEKASSLVVRDRNPQRFVRWQEDRIRKHEGKLKSFRDCKIRSQLPSHLVDLIAGFTVTSRSRELLSDEQLQAALTWGQRRANFATEKEWWKMADSSQMWTLLESIGCLAYQRQ